MHQVIMELLNGQLCWQALSFVGMLVHYRLYLPSIMSVGPTICQFPLLKSYSFCKKILSKEYINFLNFFQMYFTGVVLTVMLQVFQLTQLLQVTLVPTARCASQSHLSLLENKGIRSLRLSQSRKVILVPKGRQ